MKKIEIMVMVTAPNVVSVQWLEPLDRVNGPVYRALLSTLEEINGVERVWMFRYSAELDIATHVRRADEAAMYIAEELRDPDSEFLHALKFAFQDAELDIITPTSREKS